MPSPWSGFSRCCSSHKVSVVLWTRRQGGSAELQSVIVRVQLTTVQMDWTCPTYRTTSRCFLLSFFCSHCALVLLANHA